MTTKEVEMTTQDDWDWMGDDASETTPKDTAKPIKGRFKKGDPKTKAIAARGGAALAKRKEEELALMNALRRKLKVATDQEARERVFERLVEEAMKGGKDGQQYMRELVARVMPTARPVDPTYYLPSLAEGNHDPLSMADALMRDVAEGHIPPGEAVRLLGAVSGLLSAAMGREVVERLEALERQLGASR